MGYINPLLKLPAAQKRSELSPGERQFLAELMTELRQHANAEAEICWKRRKAPMAAYWRAVSTYARHIAHCLRHVDQVNQDPRA
ncbi:hypothetical protein [Acidovorax sp. SUPP2539]|uniref:hypothetical protein n=1 Tax=Acidovorax sp. SUPP2539 TaxID=2920878 RepID=UPI0023DE355F|nr:hypothetical protein [Acidovorax sp. SUPP2539]GKS89098.1 hypothetical protein AVTE2539_07055 [Acidovorax sp. SUPP2539]